LITKAEAMGAEDIAALLEENLEQEKHTLEEIKQATNELSKELAAEAA
jgi:ferritin-like metal-binding protein YciE